MVDLFDRLENTVYQLPWTERWARMTVGEVEWKGGGKGGQPYLGMVMVMVPVQNDGNADYTSVRFLPDTFFNVVFADFFSVRLQLRIRHDAGMKLSAGLLSLMVVDI